MKNLCWFYYIKYGLSISIYLYDIVDFGSNFVIYFTTLWYCLLCICDKWISWSLEKLVHNEKPSHRDKYKLKFMKVLICDGSGYFTTPWLKLQAEPKHRINHFHPNNDSIWKRRRHAELSWALKLGNTSPMNKMRLSLIIEELWSTLSVAAFVNAWCFCGGTFPQKRTEKYFCGSLAEEFFKDVFNDITTLDFNLPPGWWENVIA